MGFPRSGVPVARLAFGLTARARISPLGRMVRSGQAVVECRLHSMLR
jgi:hypothetical protein